MRARGLCLVACMGLGSAMTACVIDEELGEGGEVESEVESASTTPQLRGEYTFSYAGGPFGVNTDVPQGEPCSNPERERAYYTVTRISGSGSCSGNGWWDSNINNCTARIHVNAKWNEAGVCTVRIYEYPANVVIFEHSWFQGASRRFDPGVYDVAALGIGNDTLSSLRVPAGWSAQLFEHAGFINPIGIFTADTYYVGDFANDKTSSLVVTKLSGAPN